MLIKKILFLSLFLLGFSLSAQKLTYGNPSEVHMDSLFMYIKVDSLITDAIQKQAFPGAQILVAKTIKSFFIKRMVFIRMIAFRK